ncbi:MAG: ABC-F family ATP-binding cassette domain-containing protein [Litorilinea sp.]
MSILSLSNVGHSFGDFDVFQGITASIAQGGKVGMVGPNGIGKTTLLRILAGLENPTTGQIHTAQGTRIGYLRQEAMEAFHGRENSVYAEMLTVFGDIKAQEARLRELESRMATAVDAEADALLADYSSTQQAFELAGGYEYETRISQVLDGLGFGKDDWQLALSHLSGGQKTRALLARLLLEQPDLLILDEPTNHLDVEAIEWLENVLRTWEGALLIVSHDRYFLDKVVDRIWEMSRGGVEAYRGNYSAYLLQRQERWERREAEFNTIREKFLKELDYVKRNIARDSTSNMAKGRLRRLIREVKVVQAGGLHSLLNKQWGQVMEDVDISGTHWSVMDVEGAIKGLTSPIQRPVELGLKLKTAMRSGNLVLRSDEMVVGYPGAPLFSTAPLHLERQEVAALIGPNGTGKTTFLRTLMGKMDPLQGRLNFGASLKVGYFAQAHEGMDPERTVMDELLSHKHMLNGPARNYLAQYLFRGEDVYKPVKLLSGGERGRLALAILALEGANFLLLDEPTNHLDIPAQEILQQVLENFDGTILMVSHDRYLIDRLATQVWELRDNTLHTFTGTYSEFVAARAATADSQRQQASQERAATRPTSNPDRRSKNEARKRAREIADLEDKIHKTEADLVRLEQELQTASQAQELGKIQRLSTDYTRAQNQLEKLMETWADLAETA